MTHLAEESSSPSVDDCRPSLLYRAAHGDADAQAALANNALEDAVNGDAPMMGALLAAEIWTRMAASHGSTVYLTRLAGLLFIRAAWAEEDGLIELSQCHQAEAVSVLSDVADLGDEMIADWFNLISELVTPEVLALSRRYQSCIIRGA